jgi:hypothetical protein
MARNIDPHELIRFVRQLHEMHTDFHGFYSTLGQDRCKRWMDAVLPRWVESDVVVFPDQKEAAE